MPEVLSSIVVFRRRARAGALVLCVALGAARLAAEEPPTLAFELPAYDAGEPGWQPRPPSGRQLSLREAVRLALELTPTLSLKAQEAGLAAGIALEEEGAFDPNLKSDLSFEVVRQELTDSAKRNQKELRQSLRDSIAELDGQISVNQAILDEIIALETDPGGSLNDPALRANLELLDELIREADNPAARSELERLRAETLADARETYGDLVGALRQERTQDAERLTRLGEAPTQERTEEATLHLEYRLPSRLGFTLYPFFDYLYAMDRYVDKPRSADFGGKGIEDRFESRLGLGFDSPLLRGAGRLVTTAREQAARIEFEAAAAELRHEAAVVVLETGLAYFDATASRERLRSLEESVARQEELGRLTARLIRAEELPAMENARMEARLAAVKAERDRAARASHEAQVALAQVVGLELGGRDAAPEPADPLPAPPTPEQVTGLDVLGLAAAAPARRADLEAARERVRASGVLARAAQKELRPRLDLESKLSYGTRVEKSAGDALDGNWAGPSYKLALTFEKPFGNRTQRGRLLQSRAALAVDDFEARDLERRLGNQLALLAGALEQTLERLAQGRAAADAYQRLLEDERKLYEAGELTQLDLLLTEEQLTRSRLDWIEAQQSAAELVLQLRFESGTLVELPAGQRRGSVLAEALASLPVGGN
jgi:outer membrane protein TolC